MYITINGNTTDRARQYHDIRYMSAGMRNTYYFRFKRGDIVQFAWDSSPSNYMRNTNVHVEKVG